MGCYIVAALVLVTACNDNLDIQQAYRISIRNTASTQKLNVRGNRPKYAADWCVAANYQPTAFSIRYSQPDGKGKLEMDNGTVFLPNDLYPLEKETFQALLLTLGIEPTSTTDCTFISSTASGQMAATYTIHQ